MGIGLRGTGDIIVLDVGKTLSKLSRWSRTGVLLDKVTRPNAKVEVEGIAVLDAQGIGDWVTETLKSYANDAPISAIIPVAHGAGIAAISGDRLAFPPLDYEQAIPDDVMAAYRGQRDAFSDTGSPALPMGLNIGAQLHWLEAMNRLTCHPHRHPGLDPGSSFGLGSATKGEAAQWTPDQVRGDERSDTTLLPWAQYWGWFLSGVATSEVTSLGCHSDLWNPGAADFSALAKRRGWAAQFAPLAKAGDVIGALKPDFGLGHAVNVHCGLHDSNAALIAARGFPEIDSREATVLSTGTWFIAMRSPAEPFDLAALSETRDCLVNVDAGGLPVPSARFMGGREIELLGSRIDLAEDQQAMLDALPDLLANAAMILPSFAPGCGPFPDQIGAVVRRPREGGGLFEKETPLLEQTPAKAPTFAGATLNQQRAMIALYTALVADTALDLIGAKDRLLIEGRFASCDLFVRALASLRPDTKVYTSAAQADVSFGALRLVDPAIRPTGTLRPVEPLACDLRSYKAAWHQRIEGNAS